MKNFFIWVLVLTIFIIGWFSIAMMYKTENIIFYFSFMLVSCLVGCPAIWWWKDYFNNLFKNDKK